MTTRAMPASIKASAQGGVRPWCEQGSSVTTAVLPLMDAPRACASRRAMTSACGPPACCVKRFADHLTVAVSKQQPTRGLGSLRPMARSASASAGAWR